MITIKKFAASATVLGMILSTLCSCGGKDSSSASDAKPASLDADVTEAVFLGVKDYGADETNRDNMENFLYRFEVDGKECTFSINNGTKDENGNYDFPIQNVLKEKYHYNITIEDDTVTSAEETEEEYPAYTAPVSGTPGVLTLKNFLQTALMPAGTTLYIFGGGWDWQDIGADNNARSLGVSSDWVRFFNENDKDFTYKSKDGNEENKDPANSYYPYNGFNEYYYAGLDCSGFVGWIEYNTFETKSGNPGYVMYAEDMAKDLADRGFGQWTQDIKAPDGKNGYVMKPGDIMSTNGHVWVSLGTCDDGSIVVIHSTPSNSRNGQPGGGVQISAVGTDESCEAYALAEKYMSEYYPEWYERYPIFLGDPDKYFSFDGDTAGKFTWDTDNTEKGFTDPDNLQNKKPEEVLEILFG